MKHPPYHLRINKAVDRLLLVDVVRASQAFTKITPANYRYISLAGPFLEDLRVMDHFFPLMTLISLEKNLQTFKRQQFHQFNSRLDLKHISLSDFLTHEYSVPEMGIDIFWLDFTDITCERFEEFQRVLVKIPVGSIVKITLRAEADLDIGTLQKASLINVQQEWKDNFDKEFYRFMPYEAPHDAFLAYKAYARMVQLMIKNATSIVWETSGYKNKFLPIHSVYYRDNTYMLSVTGGVFPVASEEQLASEEQVKVVKEVQDAFGSVKFCDFDWNEPVEINIPDLSLKERMKIEHLLPIDKAENSGAKLHEALTYFVADGRKGTEQQLAMYAEYYRDYPNFLRISS